MTTEGREIDVPHTLLQDTHAVPPATKVGAQQRSGSGRQHPQL
jgi:hypothetical protein